MERNRSMKHVKNRLVLLLLLAVLVMLPSMTGFAAAKEPGTVKGLKAKAASESSIKLTWKRASNASGYRVYRVDPESGKTKRIATTTRTSYTVKNLKPNAVYTYQVRAYSKSGKKTVLADQLSAPASAKLTLRKPSKPSGIKVDTPADLSIELKWNSAKNATGYYVYMYDETAKTYKKIATTKSRSYRITKLKEGKTYKFQIQSYRSVQGVKAESAVSGTVSGKAKSMSKLAKQVHGRYFNATLRKTVTATVSGTKEKVKLKKGTKVTSTGRTSNTITVIMKDGRKTKVSGKNLRYNSMKTVKSDFSKAAKEAFVNEKGYSSNTGYLIWISQYTTKVNVFRGSKGKWKLVKTFRCIVGKDGRTPTGVHRIRFSEPYSFSPGYRIYFTWNPVKQWGNSFHGWTSGARSGAHSSGCVRMDSSSLNYIRDHCGAGTTVVSY